MFGRALTSSCPPLPWMPAKAGMTVVMQGATLAGTVESSLTCHIRAGAVLNPTGEDSSHAVGSYEVASVGSDVGGAIALGEDAFDGLLDGLSLFFESE